MLLTDVALAKAFRFSLVAIVLCGTACSRDRSTVTTTPSTPPPAGQPGAPALAGSNWRLVEFRSSDDAIGVIRPDDPAKYTMVLGSDGRAIMRLDCNRANGPWSAKASSQDSGTFQLGPLAMTRALCAPPSLDQQIAKHAEYMRTYLLRGGNLYVNLMADGGTYMWTPDSSASAAP